MDYVTRRGTFPSLNTLREAYINSEDGGEYRLTRPWGEKWDKTVLHASDVGGCPRAAMYRLLGTPEKPRNPETSACRTVMLERGTEFHWLTYSALNWAGILVGHEVDAAPREGWAGSLDALVRPNINKETVIGFDEKTVLPNMLTYHRKETPKRNNCLQVATYCMTQPFKWATIEYADRAGANRPEECEFDATEWMAEADTLMDYLEFCQGQLPNLPDTLEQEYVAHYSDRRLNSVSLDTPWFCRYCDYHLCKKEQRVNPNSGRMKEYGWTQKDSTCKPYNVPPKTVAEVKNGKWTFKDDSDDLQAFLAAQVTTLPVYEEEE